eukprot:PhM_4_TR1207/c0_g1_i1/m.20724
MGCKSSKEPTRNKPTPGEKNQQTAASNKTATTTTTQQKYAKPSDNTNNKNITPSTTTNKPSLQTNVPADTMMVPAIAAPKYTVAELEKMLDRGRPPTSSATREELRRYLDKFR